MKKLRAISIIFCIIVVIVMTATATYAWFDAGKITDSTVLHQANSPQANVEIHDIEQTGDLSPAVPYVNSVGVPSYISDKSGFDAYVENNSLLEADETYIAKAAQAVQLTGKFKYEGKDDGGTDVGKRTLVVQLEAKNRITGNEISAVNFAYNFEADTDNDESTPALIVKLDKERERYYRNKNTNNVFYTDEDMTTKATGEKFSNGKYIGEDASNDYSTDATSGIVGLYVETGTKLTSSNYSGFYDAQDNQDNTFYTDETMNRLATGEAFENGRYISTTANAYSDGDTSGIVGLYVKEQDGTATQLTSANYTQYYSADNSANVFYTDEDMTTVATGTRFQNGRYISTTANAYSTGATSGIVGLYVKKGTKLTSENYSDFYNRVEKVEKVFYTDEEMTTKATGLAFDKDGKYIGATASNEYSADATSGIVGLYVKEQNGTATKLTSSNYSTYYDANAEIFSQVLTIEVDPSVAPDDWYWFKMTIYFSNIDDHMDATLNGLPIDFTMNIIAA